MISVYPVVSSERQRNTLGTFRPCQKFMCMLSVHVKRKGASTCCAADHPHNVILMRLVSSPVDVAQHTRPLLLFPNLSFFPLSMYTCSRVLHQTSRSFSSPTSLSAYRKLLLPPSFLSLPPISVLVRFKMTDTNQGGDATKKTYHKKATGSALVTVKNRSKDDDLKLYGSAFWYAYHFTPTLPTDPP
jgi:hypothetical protein